MSPAQAYVLNKMHGLQISQRAIKQSAVNRAVLMSLDRLNDNFVTSQQYDDEFVDSEPVLLEEQTDNPANLDIQADIDSLIQTIEAINRLIIRACLTQLQMLMRLKFYNMIHN